MMVNDRRTMCLRAGCTETPDFSDACASCPAGHWPAWGDDDCTPGLGSQIEAFAKPIAQVADKLLGTNVAGCGGCAKMKARLNDGMPFVEAVIMRISGQ